MVSAVAGAPGWPATSVPAPDSSAMAARAAGLRVGDMEVPCCWSPTLERRAEAKGVNPETFAQRGRRAGVILASPSRLDRLPPMTWSHLFRQALRMTLRDWRAG